MKNEPTLRRLGSPGSNHHRFGPPQRQHGVAHLPHRGRPGRRGRRQRLLELAVADRGHATRAQLEGHADHDPAIGLALEDAVAVAEPTLVGCQLAGDQRRAIQDLDRADHLRHLLTVGADVLDGRRAGESGNSRKAFDPGQSARHGRRDDAIPRLARRHLHPFEIACARKGDPAAGDAHHQPREAGIAHDQVRSTAQHQHRQSARLRPAQRLDQRRRVGGDRQVARRSPQLKGGHRRQRDVGIDREGHVTPH